MKKWIVYVPCSIEVTDIEAETEGQAIDIAAGIDLVDYIAKRPQDFDCDFSYSEGWLQYESNASEGS